VTDIATLLEIAGSVAVVAAPVILLVRWLGNAQGPTLVDILAQPLDPPWPRGIQEEEPVRWRVEAVRPPHQAERSADTLDPRFARRAVVAVGPETGPCA